MTFSALLSALPDAIPFLPSDPVITFLTPDPDRCTEETLFLCIPGFHRNGHDAIPQALAHGAVAFVIAEGYPTIESFLKERDLPYAVVSEPRSAEAYLTSRFYGDPWKELHITAVTGTNGKTTVVSMLSAIYETAGYRTATIGTLTGKLTTPDPAELYPLLASLREHHVSHVFMEVSSHALALGKTAPIRYEAAIFTNLTPEHLDFHGTMDAYAAAKAQLFPAAERVILNADDPYAETMAKNALGRIYRCSTLDPTAEFRALHILSNGPYGIAYDLATRDRVFRIRSSIPGRFTVMNTLLAATSAFCGGIPQDIIRGALCRFRGVKGRLERIDLPTNDFSVYIDFAHTPDALENILRTVRDFIRKDSRLVLLFGCGGDRDKSKRQVMGQIASRLADFVIVTSDNCRSEQPRDIIRDILTGIDENCSHTVIEDRRQAIEFAVRTALSGDVILLTGKGHEDYEIRADGIHPFSEREIVMQATKRYLKDHGLY